MFFIHSQTFSYRTFFFVLQRLHGYKLRKRNICFGISWQKASFNNLIFLLIFEAFYVDNLYCNKPHHASPVSF
nr:MAG TPA: hypothetical protein [Caudoviricetes sp.]DAX64128.1 MAG TPA: hypothetical protein [Caudoviricetes sp.]